MIKGCVSDWVFFLVMQLILLNCCYNFIRVCICTEAVTEATGRWKYAPDDVPTFLVCTPKYLANFIQGPIIHEEALFESIRYLVLDEVHGYSLNLGCTANFESTLTPISEILILTHTHEIYFYSQADMLLDGSYLKDVEKILDALKVVRRGLIREGLVKVSKKFDILLSNSVRPIVPAHMHLLTLNIFKVHEQVTQFVLSAATIPSFGLKSVKAYIQKKFPRVTNHSIAFHVFLLFLLTI